MFVFFGQNIEIYQTVYLKISIIAIIIIFYSLIFWLWNPSKVGISSSLIYGCILYRSTWSDSDFDLIENLPLKNISEKPAKILYVASLHVFSKQLFFLNIIFYL